MNASWMSVESSEHEMEHDTRLCNGYFHIVRPDLISSSAVSGRKSLERFPNRTYYIVISFDTDCPRAKKSNSRDDDDDDDG